MALFFDADWFDAALSARGLTRPMLGLRLGLDDQALADMWKDQREVSARDVAAMAEFFGLPPAEIADRAGVSTPVLSAVRPVDEVLVDALARIRRLEAELSTLRADLEAACRSI